MTASLSLTAPFEEEAARPVPFELGIELVCAFGMRLVATVNRIVVLAVFALVVARDAPGAAKESETVMNELVALPPVARGSIPLDDALRQRRSVRSFSTDSLSLEQVSQLCWAAQGVTDPKDGHRTAPSAGALYPLELYVVVRAGVFHYEPREHRLRRVRATDERRALSTAALGQAEVASAGLDLVFIGVASRTRSKYGDRAERYVHLEAGHAAQNVLLEATALGLGAVPIGAFDDDAVRTVVGASKDEEPLYVIPVGRR